LNHEKRKRDLMKITIENQAILRRLQAKNATYSVEKWESQFKEQIRYRDNISEAPYEFNPADPTVTNMFQSKIAPAFNVQRNLYS